ncbi:hypothetical protein [Saccharomonospora piscinae]|uniref:hypothetical protein n=1 Tax=Saccharomonospora piscinae TaxID=687388 RepID=UPI00111C3B89|nr:hypothetical protein [Saccharomonospora piscinae]
MKRLIVDGALATNKAIRNLSEWSVWVTMLLFVFLAWLVAGSSPVWLKLAALFLAVFVVRGIAEGIVPG